MRLEKKTWFQAREEYHLHLTEEEAQKLVDTINEFKGLKEPHETYGIRPIPTELKDIDGHTIQISLDSAIVLFAKIIIDRGDKK